MKRKLSQIIRSSLTLLLLLVILLLARYSRPAALADLTINPDTLSAVITQPGADGGLETRELSLPWGEAEEAAALLSPLSLHRSPFNPIRSLLGLSPEGESDQAGYTLTFTGPGEPFSLRFDGEDWFYAHGDKRFFPCTVSGVEAENLGQLLWDLGEPETGPSDQENS